MAKGVRREVVGSGIVRKVRDVVDLVEAAPEVADAALGSFADSWRWNRALHPLIEWLEQQLALVERCPGYADPRCCGRWKLSESEGWPPCRGGNWRELNDIEWYVRDVHQRVGYLRDQVERGDTIGAAIFGVELGAAILQLQLKRGPEEAWLWGREKRDCAQRGGKASRGKGTDEQRCASVDDLRARNPSLSLEACYRLAAKKFAVSHQTIKLSCRKHRLSVNN